tara:strand:- start:147 stop:3155 length:3009 start_codon:yes stop_codon:yes gene_type:complete
MLSEENNILWQETPFLELQGSYDKVNPVPLVSENGKRLSLNILEDFTASDTVYVDGLRVLVNDNISDHVFLSLNEITYQDTILNWIRVGDVSFNSSNQLFLKNVDLDQRVLNTIKIGQGETAIIDSIFDIVIRLPMDSYFTWHDEQIPSYNFSNNQGGSVVNEISISEDYKNLTIPVINFPLNDTLSIGNLYFGNFTTTDSIHLTLGLDGANNSMILEDTAYKIVSGFELDFEQDWNFVVGDTGTVSVLPKLFAYNDRFNILNKADVYITLPNPLLTWDTELEMVDVYTSSDLLTTYSVNRLNDSIIHIPSGLPIESNDSIYFSGLSLGSFADTLYPVAPKFTYTIAADDVQVDNNLTVASAYKIGVGYPKIEYVQDLSFPLNSEVSKNIEQISIFESSVPVFGPKRDLIISLSPMADEIINISVENSQINEPLFIKSIASDSITFGFSRKTQAYENIVIPGVSLSTEPFYNLGYYLNTNSLKSSYYEQLSISHSSEGNLRIGPIDSGPAIIFYPSFLFDEVIQYQSGGIQKLSIEIFPSLIDTDETNLASIFDYNYRDMSGLFDNDLGSMYETIQISRGVHSKLSSGTDIILDKIIIDLNQSVIDSINKYSDLNRFYDIDGRLSLELLRSNIGFNNSIDTTGFLISRASDISNIDVGYDLNNIVLQPETGTLSNNDKNLLRLLIPDFSYEKSMTITDLNDQIIVDIILPSNNDSIVQILDQDLQDGNYNVTIVGSLSDTVDTFPIMRQFKIDNQVPQFVQNSSDSLFSFLSSLGKNNSGHLISKNEFFQFSISDQDTQEYRDRNYASDFFFNDSLMVTLKINIMQNADSVFTKDIWLPSTNTGLIIPSFSMSFDSLLTFLLESEKENYVEDKNSFELNINVVDQAGNDISKVLYFSTDYSGNKIGEEIFNYPNPFSNLNGQNTRVRYVVLDQQTSGHFYIMNLGGDLVYEKKLKSESLSNGSHEIIWEGENIFGESLSSGVYLGLLKIGNENKKIKIVIRN